MTEAEKLLIQIASEPIFFTLGPSRESTGEILGIESHRSPYLNPFDMERIKDGVRILIGSPDGGFDTTIKEVQGLYAGLAIVKIYPSWNLPGWGYGRPNNWPDKIPVWILGGPHD